MSDSPPEPRVARPAGRPAAGVDLADMQSRLHACATTEELLARAAEEACLFCGFTRGLVLRFEHGRLTAGGISPLRNPESDALRRRVLSDPVPLIPGTPEAQLVRRAGGARRARATQPSALASALGLAHHALAAVAPESRVLAVVVVDRDGPLVDEHDEWLAELFAHLLGLAILRGTLRARLGEFSAELRHFSNSAQALVQEALTAPAVLSSDYGHGPVFTWTSAVSRAGAGTPIHEVLSRREIEIVQLMVEGLSNRKIGERLNLSPDTVKDHVARILPKLGAANRVEAVGCYMRLTAPSQG